MDQFNQSVDRVLTSTDAAMKFGARSAQPSTQRLTVRLRALLANFYTPDHDPAVELQMALDWVSSLSDLPFEAVDEACRDWLKRMDRRPAIAELRELAVDAAENNRIRSQRYLPSPTRDSEAMRRWKGMFRPGEYYPTVDDLRRIESEINAEKRQAESSECAMYKS